MQSSAVGKEAETRTETRALRRTTPSRWRRCRVVGREQGSSPELRTGTKARIFTFCYHFGIILIQGQKADGSTEAVFACALAEGGQRGFGGGPGRGLRGEILGHSDFVSCQGSERVSASNSAHFAAPARRGPLQSRIWTSASQSEAWHGEAATLFGSGLFASRLSDCPIGFHANLVVPGTGIGGVASAPNSYLGGLRSSLELRIISGVMTSPV